MRNENNMESITKEKVIAEIKELYNDIDKCISELITARSNRDDNGISNAHWRMETLMVNTQQAICNVIDTLEVKEVDLEKEFYDFLDTLIGKDNGHLSEDELFRIAEYFFELGLNARKGK